MMIVNEINRAAEEAASAIAACRKVSEQDGSPLEALSTDTLLTDIGRNLELAVRARKAMHEGSSPEATKGFMTALASIITEALAVSRDERVDIGWAVDDQVQTMKWDAEEAGYERQ